MSKSNKHKIPINVSSKILRHISRGIYRSPAGALKELVSNSYDAGAKKVTINTNYPALNKMIITDNGNGMTFEHFKKIIAQIGLSGKEVGHEVSVVNSSKKTKRKIIGHYGIGFLAIGQLTSKATIMSKISGTNMGFKAILDFEQFEDIPSRTNQNTNNQKKFQIGTCNVEIVEFDSSANKDSFTKIELIEIRPDVKRTILGEDTSIIFPKADDQKPYSSNFESIISLIRENEEKRQGKGKILVIDYSYEELLWELSVYAPLPFPQNAIFLKGGELEEFSLLANGFEFELNIDGFIAKKPYDEYFWQEKKGFKPIIFKWVDEEFEKGKKINAFLVFQPATMIRPKKMQGVIIRNDGVSIGLYDFTYMKYPFFEGTKFASLTGEIFATGLEDSMNVDRDSFNQTADDYVSLKKWFHKKLFEEVFDFIKNFNQGKESPTRTKNKELIIEVIELLIRKSETIKKVEFKNLGSKEKKRIIIQKDIMIINSDHKDNNLNTTNREKLLFAATLIINGLITDDDYNTTLDQLENLKKAANKDEAS